MKIKNIWESKINWTAVGLILVSLQSQIGGLDLSKMTVQSWITFGIGILVLVLRTYSTSIPIGTPAKVAEFKATGTTPSNP